MNKSKTIAATGEDSVKRDEEVATPQPTTDRGAEVETPKHDPSNDERILASLEDVVEEDASVAWAKRKTQTRLRKRDAKSLHFFTPLPHYRHLSSLMASCPHETLLPALLRGEACEGLTIVQGPPGTGKTRTLVSTLSELNTDARVLLVTSTNVGAANLYSTCLEQGWRDECSLVLALGRTPLGTTVLSTDPKRRIVCATVSGRGGPRLDDERFDVVLLDEAAQCMEACTWTFASGGSSGGTRRRRAAATCSRVHFGQIVAARPIAHGASHGRSFVPQFDLTQGSTSHGTRAALLFPTKPSTVEPSCAERAPASGSVEWIHVPDGYEEKKGTSFVNRKEARAAVERISTLVQAGEDASSIVLLTSYAAQVKVLLSHRTGCEVHTIDSFQGRECKTIVLSVVKMARKASASGRTIGV